MIEEALSVTATAYYDYPKRPNPKWSATLAHSVAVYKSELNKLRAADNWRLIQSMKKAQTQAQDEEE